MNYTGFSPGQWTELVDALRPPVPVPAGSLEGAAQLVARALHDALPASTALARVYATLAFKELPPDVASFVTGLAAKHQPALAPTTPVLGLLGTYGAEPAWQHRSRSQGHKAIPLVSAAFVEAIPMLARLLKELGLDLRSLDAAPEVATRRMLGGFNGLFYVEDARTARDAQGRLVIPAADFVARERVQTVFGLGGIYPDGTLVVCIVFARERIPRAKVEMFTSLMGMLKGETFGHVLARRLFARPATS